MPVNSSEANLDTISHQSESETICLQCGDRGFTNAFVYCIKCLKFAVHRYCLYEMPKSVNEFARWVCDDCDKEVRNQPVQAFECIIEGNLEGGRQDFEDCVQNVKQEIKTDQPMAPREGGSMQAHSRATSSSSSSNVDVFVTSSECRARLTIIGGTLNPSGEISGKLKLIFTQSIHPDGVTWKRIPHEHRTRYYEEFKKYFFWDQSMDAKVYSLWKVKAAERYREMIYRIKLKGERPAYISEDAWPSFEAYWASDDAQEKSRIAHKNRMSEPDGPGTGIVTHRGGSRSAQQYAISVAKEKGLPMEEIGWEVFLRLHSSNGVFSSAKASRIADEVRRRAAESCQPVSMTKIFLEVVGDISKKNRLFGVGSRSKNYMEGSSADSQASDLSEHVKMIKKSVDANYERLREEFREQMESTIKEQVEAFCLQFIAKYGPPPLP